MSHHFQAATIAYLASLSAQLRHMIEAFLLKAIFFVASTVAIIGPRVFTEAAMVAMTFVIIRWITSLNRPDAKEE